MMVGPVVVVCGHVAGGRAHPVGSRTGVRISDRVGVHYLPVEGPQPLFSLLLGEGSLESLLADHLLEF